MSGDPFSIGKIDKTRGAGLSGGISNITSGQSAGASGGVEATPKTDSSAKIDETDKVQVTKESQEAGGASAAATNIIGALQAPSTQTVNPANGVAETKGLDPGMQSGGVFAAGPGGFSGGGDAGMGGGAVHTTKPAFA